MKNIRIYQVNEELNESTRFLAYSGLDFLKRMGMRDEVKKDNYKIVYDGAHEVTTIGMNENSVYGVLEDIYMRFNRGAKPEDYRGHSLSVSDIVEMDGKFYYCDSWGFVNIKF